MDVHVFASKSIKLFISDMDMCVYITESGMCDISVTENINVGFKYHVVKETAYGDICHDVKTESEVNEEFGIDIKELLYGVPVQQTEEEQMNDMLDFMLLERKHKVNK